MYVRIWGARGSIPAPPTPQHVVERVRRVLRDLRPEDLHDEESRETFLSSCRHAKYHGGNTTCIEVRLDDVLIIVDAGSGLRLLGESIVAEGLLQERALHFLFGHFHWDHLCGLPFFAPLYMPGQEIDIHSWREAEDIDRILRVQMDDVHFPVKWPRLRSTRRCHQLAPDQVHDIGSASVRLLRLSHPDGAYGYRIEHGGRSIVSLLDTEISRTPDQHSDVYADFVEGADVVLVDAMYGFLDYHEHYDFGHSSVFTWIDFFKESQIGEVVLCHHDPNADDPALFKLLESAQRYKDLIAPDAPWRISCGHEGQCWQLE